MPVSAMGSTIAFDIEVAGFPWEEVDEITRGYLLARTRDERERESVPERMALYPWAGGDKATWLRLIPAPLTGRRIARTTA